MLASIPGRLSYSPPSSGRKLISMLKGSWRAKGGLDQKSWMEEGCMVLERGWEGAIAWQMGWSNSISNMGTSLGVRVRFLASGLVCLR